MTRNRTAIARAFTLIEVLVVVAIISVLVAILFPSLRRAREDARRTVCMANLKQVAAGVFSYAASNRDLGPMVMKPLYDRSPRELLSVPPALVSAPPNRGLVNLGLMWPRNTAEAMAFICPSQRLFPYPADIRLLRTDFVAGSYVYAVHVPAGESPPLGAVRHLALGADDFTATKDGTPIGNYVHRVGYNVLYSDGSVNWYPDPNRSIARRAVRWPRESETSEYDYYHGTGQSGGYGGAGGTYDDAVDLFTIWRSFCYRRPDPF
ncbi:MAG: DUF1559 domain-containing protein [Planctomycetes bacterium]|nr:DUF1559 domain-containing protein [Planctomycetota bacterium]